MLRIAVVGANGRMGRELITAISQNYNCQLTVAVVHPDSQLQGQDVGSYLGLGTLGVAFSHDLNAYGNDFDVLIDFTSPEYSLQNLAFCQSQGKKLVLGTTGFSSSQKQQIAQVAKSIPVVFASNFSIGMNLVFKLLEKASAVMGADSDIEIIEAHHNRKVDAPSGTALAMGEHIAKSLHKNLEDIAVFERHGMVGERKDGEIGFATIRAGNIVGEHSAWFVTAGERVEISHKATSRSTFAQGAVRSALWLADQPQGLYDMTNVLGLDKL